MLLISEKFISFPQQYSMIWALKKKNHFSQFLLSLKYPSFQRYQEIITIHFQYKASYISAVIFKKSYWK